MSGGHGKLVFSVKPRLLRLLGDQLIRDANVAVFELVKNAYDADATKCQVTIENADDPAKARIEIEDNGCGMDRDVIQNIWMVIATDFREKQRAEGRRTKGGRFPLGEKGLGRLSVHKLGKFIRLITRAKGGDELVVEFDWERLENASDLREASVKIVGREPTTFPGRKHGTRLEVTQLRESWARGELRSLHRAVSALCSPFKGPADFEVVLSAPGFEGWLQGLLTPGDVHRCALYHITGSFNGGLASFNYSFRAPPGSERRLSSRSEHVTNLVLEKRSGRNSLPLDLSSHAIGEVEFEFFLFDRDPAVIRSVTDDVKGLKDYLDDNGGIRVYREGLRVYDFGEPGNDWLNLDLRRVNTPTVKTSNNQVLGVLYLDGTKSGDLREKSNREGFIESKAYQDFREAVICVLTSIEAEKTKDQRRVREALGKGTGQKLFAKLTELRQALSERGILAEVEPRLKEVERELEVYRDQLLHAAVPGLTIGIMLHGAEKLLDELRLAAKAKGATPRISELVERLYRAMRPVTNLLKNPGVTQTTAVQLIKDAVFSTELRLKRHGVQLVNGVESGCSDFKLRGSRQMLVAAIANLIDNSIHWLEVKQPPHKLLYVSTTTDLDGEPAIIVADNGPGFGGDDPEDLVAPFFSRRNGGMGLGLYIVNEVMRVNKGRLTFPARGDVELPRGVNGAVVALQFPQSS